MQIPGHVVCDICQTPKKETNHWLVAVTHASLTGIIFVPTEVSVRWNDKGAVYQDICGQACAHKCLGQWLEFITAH